MKKFIAFIMASIMLLSLCACSDNSDIAVIGGADGPTTIVVGEPSDTPDEPVDTPDTPVDIPDEPVDEPVDTPEEPDDEEVSVDETEEVILSDLPARVDWEEIFLGDENGGIYRIYTAYAADGSVMWTYKTPNSMAAQLETLEYLGMHNGLVYINEQALYDSEPNVEGMVETYGRLRTLDAKTGEMMWDYTDYDGGASAFDFDEEGNIYIGGYLGPDCVKISPEGITCWKVNYIDPDIYWLYDMKYDNGKVILSFDIGKNGEPQTVTLNAADGTVIG